MKICYWGTFDREYPRNAILISGLRQNGIDVIECRFDLWKQSFRYNKLALLKGFRNKLRFVASAVCAYPVLIYRYLWLREHDAVVVGYWGHIDVFFLAAFAKLQRKPIIFDAFFSLYDTAISDWGLAPKNSLFARLCYFLDWSACRLATLVLVDTEAQSNFFRQEFGLAKEKVSWLYMGADDSVFTPYREHLRPDPFRVLYVGNYVPLHGVSIILQAAQLLDREDIEFWLIGENHRGDTVLKSLLSDSNPERVKFYPWMAPHDLRTRLGEADVCLGLFGTSGKAKRVIPGKAFLALAMGKPLITGDSMAARELLEDGKNAILCELGNPQALADAILRLRRDPGLRQCIGDEGRKLFENRCRPEIVGMQFAHLIQETLKQKDWRGVEAGERDHT
jgi:glycosyltransferase involved in cell wall biosynthesis